MILSVLDRDELFRWCSEFLSFLSLAFSFAKTWHSHSGENSKENVFSSSEVLGIAVPCQELNMSVHVPMSPAASLQTTHPYYQAPEQSRARGWFLASL